MGVLKEIIINFFKEPFTELHPFVKKKPKERFRGRILYEADRCIGCRLCEKYCPVKAVDFHEKGRIDFDMGKCIYCGLCRDVCPVKCIHYTHAFEYASSNKEKLRKNLV